MCSAVTLVFTAEGVNQSIFSDHTLLDAIGCRVAHLTIIDILWTIQFTSEEDWLMFYIFNSMDIGGLTTPSRLRHTMSVHNMHRNGYMAGYAAAGSIGSMKYDAKMNSIAGPLRSSASSKNRIIEVHSMKINGVHQVALISSYNA
ncbi:hypothetical protein EIP86_008946 [Pleurotus ostreatoroseus]|nr:hypothetical protein EIP86_008946 [Pleurotus ostreatoroseus]